MKRTVTPRATVRLDAYAIISRAVADGVEWGWNRAHKHTDTPEPDALRDTIADNVMLTLDDIIIWEERNEQKTDG